MHFYLRFTVFRFNIWNKWNLHFNKDSEIKKRCEKRIVITQKILDFFLNFDHIIRLHLYWIVFGLKMVVVLYNFIGMKK